MKIWVKFFLYGIFVLISSELFLRFLDPPSLSYYRNVKLLHRYHPEYYVTLGKNLDLYIKHYNHLWEGRFTTNSLGFRGSPEPDSDSPKLACLGDSLVMGFGVSDEDTFCNRLNGLEWGGKKFQSQNLAVDAYGSLGSAKRLKESAEKLELDTVLFFVSPNDFTVPPGLVEQGVLADDIIEKQRENDDSYRRKFYLQFELTRLSYLLQAIKLAKEQLAIKSLFAKREMLSEWSEAQSPIKYLRDSFYRFPNSPNCDKDTSSETKTETMINSPTCPEPILSESDCVPEPPNTDELIPLPDETIYAYNLMLSTVQDHNIRLVVVFIPMQNEDLRCYNNGKHSPLYEYSLRSKAFFDSKNVETIELIDRAGEICPIDDYFIPGDGHLTKKGNEWVAKTLKEKLLELEGKN